MHNLPMLFMSALVMAILLTSRTYGIESEERGSRCFRGMLASNMAMSACMIIIILIDRHVPEGRVTPFLLCMVNIFYYVLLVLFVRYIDYSMGEKAHLTGWFVRSTIVVCFFSCLGWLFSAFTGVFAAYRNGRIVQGPLYWLGQVGGYYVIIGLVLFILWNREKLGRKDTYVLLSFPVVPIVVVSLRLIDNNYIWMPVAITMSLLLIFVAYHERLRQEMLEQQRRMQQAQVDIMRSQIAPHFLYNVLNSIYFLCESNPEAAQKAVNDFSEYLRANLSSIENKKEITMMEEMEHIRHYLNLEKMRFGDELIIDYDIETEDFRLPPLTVQPIVENAVKHGIRKKEGVGEVRISVREENTCYRIEITDTGAGFDPEEAFARDDGRTHIGLANVKERLSHYHNSTLEIKSVIGQGTQVVIRIAKHTD